MRKHHIIQSCFLFFLENVNKDHWVISCLCNPWVYMQKAMKSKDPDTLVEQFERVDEDFIHGWLTLDPLHGGFMNRENFDDDYKKTRDVLVWLLNLAALYSDCSHENILINIDFTMNCLLNYHYMTSWIKDFRLDGESWKAFQESQKEIEKNDSVVPPAFHFVVKWFVYGLDGPFGKVSGTGTKKVLFHCIPEDKKNPKEIFTNVYDNLLPHSTFLQFKQKDIVNCGACCAMFIFDMLITQAFTTWKIKMPKNGHLPKSFKFGSSILSSDVYDSMGSKGHDFNPDTHLLYLYTLFREELVILIEMLQFLQMDSNCNYSSLNYDLSWGERSKFCTFHQDILCNHLSFDEEKARKLPKLEDNSVRNNLFQTSYIVLNAMKSCDHGNLPLLNTNLGSTFTNEDEFSQLVDTLFAPTFEDHIKIPKDLVECDDKEDNGPISVKDSNEMDDSNHSVTKDASNDNDKPQSTQTSNSDHDNNIDDTIEDPLNDDEDKESIQQC